MHPFITLLSFVGVINAFSLLDPLEKRADAVIDNATTSALPSRYIVEFTKVRKNIASFFKETSAYNK